MKCLNGCRVVAMWHCSLGLSPNALGVLRTTDPTISANYVNHVRPDKVRGDSTSSFYRCHYHSAQGEPFRYLRSRVAEDQLSHHRLWRPSPRLSSYVNSPPFPFTLELRSFTAQVELLPMTSGAWNMLLVLASGPTNLNLGVCGP